MRVRWYGQSAFALAAGHDSVFIDPFGDMAAARGRGMTWSYPAIADAVADLLLVTHEHGDHNAVQVIADVKQTVRSSAGTVDTQVWHSVESDRMLWDYESSADGHAWSSTWHIAYRRAE